MLGMRAPFRAGAVFRRAVRRVKALRAFGVDPAAAAAGGGADPPPV